MKHFIFSTLLIFLFSITVIAAEINVMYDQPLQDWDGFGVNYVETAQTRDYVEWPQDYGGFSILSEEDQEAIVELIFGNDGLKPALVKQFIDPFHEGETLEDNDNEDHMVINLAGYDMETTTKSMRYFGRKGLELTRNRGDDLTFINTLYGPPPWTTEQRMVRGRDLDPDLLVEVAEYIAAFAKFMREEEGLPVKYVSIHNEGFHPIRYNVDGRDAENLFGHDYNVLWKANQIAKMMVLLREVLDANGMKDIKPTPGETTYWSFFHKVAHTLVENEDTVKTMGLITSHGFDGNNDPSSNWYSPIQDYAGIRMIRNLRPDLHAWTTSASWGDMDVNFIDLIYRSIYQLELNGFIPWAAVQRHTQWTGGDPNPGTAILVQDNGQFEVRRGYYLYKQICPFGRPGMKVVATKSNDPYIKVIAFGNNGTDNPDSFIVLNQSWIETDCTIDVSGNNIERYDVYRTIVDTFSDDFWMSEKPDIEHFKKIDDSQQEEGVINYSSPPLSVTTFVAK